MDTAPRSSSLQVNTLDRATKKMISVEATAPVTADEVGRRGRTWAGGQRWLLVQAGGRAGARGVPARRHAGQPGVRRRRRRRSLANAYGMGRMALPVVAKVSTATAAAMSRALPLRSSPRVKPMVRGVARRS